MHGSAFPFPAVDSGKRVSGLFTFSRIRRPGAGIPESVSESVGITRSSRGGKGALQWCTIFSPGLKLIRFAPKPVIKNPGIIDVSGIEYYSRNRDLSGSVSTVSSILQNRDLPGSVLSTFVTFLQY